MLGNACKLYSSNCINKNILKTETQLEVKMLTC